MNIFLIKNHLRSFLKKIRELWYTCFNNKKPLQHSIIPEPFSIIFFEEKTIIPKHIFVFIEHHQELFDQYFHRNNEYTFSDIKENSFIIFKKTKLSTYHNDEYSITVDKKITITYFSQNGLQFALVTLHKILFSAEKRETIQKMTIIDYPKYDWRGLHIDVARHFMPIDFLKQLVIQMSFLKLNKLHIHFTDDQGWRLESKMYPKLHEIGSIRHETVVGKQFSFFHNTYKGDHTVHNGFYTQNELKNFILFADNYGIEIIPEIDIPGHATALLAAYPEHAAKHPPKNIATTWGIFNNVLSPDDSTILFLKNIFSEFSSVFSSRYFHIGGDEIPTVYYKNNATVKSLIHQRVISSYQDAPKYILDHISKHVQSLGKIPIMWDEAAETAKNNNGVVMAWQNLEIMNHVARIGLPYICTSSSHFYFDYYQNKNTHTEPIAIGGFTPIEKVYNAELPNDSLLMGVQANMWTEYTKTPEQVMYMLFPRMYALSEIAWGKNKPNLNNFLQKVTLQNFPETSIKEIK